MATAMDEKEKRKKNEKFLIKDKIEKSLNLTRFKRSRQNFISKNQISLGYTTPVKDNSIRNQFS